MAGQVTVTVELADGMQVSFSRFWSGGNKAYEGLEAEDAASLAAGDIRRAIDATHGATKNPTSAPLSWPGKGGL